MKVEWKVGVGGYDELHLDGYYVERRDWGKIIDPTPSGKALIAWREDFIVNLPNGAQVKRTVTVEDTYGPALDVHALIVARANAAREAFESMSKEITLRMVREA